MTGHPLYLQTAYRGGPCPVESKWKIVDDDKRLNTKGEGGETAKLTNDLD